MPLRTWPPSLVPVSVSDYRTREPRLIPGWAPILQCVFFSSFFSGLILNYFKLVILNYKNDKHFHSLSFGIELCSKSVGVGLNVDL